MAYHSKSGLFGPVFKQLSHLNSGQLKCLVFQMLPDFEGSDFGSSLYLLLLILDIQCNLKAGHQSTRQPKPGSFCVPPGSFRVPPWAQVPQVEKPWLRRTNLVSPRCYMKMYLYLNPLVMNKLLNPKTCF